MDQKLKNETLYLLKENTSIFLYNPSIGKTINFASFPEVTGKILIALIT